MRISDWSSDVCSSGLCDFLQHLRIVDRRRHGVVAAVGDRAHRRAQYLAGARLRQACDHGDLLECGARTDLLATAGDQFTRHFVMRLADAALEFGRTSWWERVG